MRGLCRSLSFDGTFGEFDFQVTAMIILELDFLLGDILYFVPKAKLALYNINVLYLLNIIFGLTLIKLGPADDFSYYFLMIFLSIKQVRIR